MNEQQNVKVVQDAYAAFKSGDMTGLLHVMADDVKWYLPGPKDILPFVGARRGRDEVKQFFASVAENQEPEQFDPREFVAQGDQVVALGQYRWLVKGTRQSFTSDFAHVFTIRNGKISSFHEYFDTQAAVTAYRGAHTAGAH
jgi:ketosteroid isomerase-like protein